MQTIRIGSRLRHTLILAACLAVRPVGSAASQPIVESEIEFHAGETRLAGTLLVPSSRGPHAAVVLLGGSDRSARGPAKERLARAFAEGGVIALTYDSPGTGRSSGSALTQTRIDRAREAIAAIRFLRGVEGVAADRVGVCGGSEGAGVALMAASLDSSAAFSIAISGGFGLTIMELSRYRIDAMGLRRGLSDEDILRAHALEEILYALLSGQDVVEWRLVRARTERWTDEPWNDLIGFVESCRGDLTDARKQELWIDFKRILARWMHEAWFEVAIPDRRNLDRVLAMDATMFFSFLARSPLAAGAWYVGPEEIRLLTGVRCPVLAVWGQQDDFFAPHRSAAWLGAILEQAGNDDVTLRILPEGDHSLWNDRIDAYAAGYPELLPAWVKERMGSTPQE